MKFNKGLVFIVYVELLKFAQSATDYKALWYEGCSSLNNTMVSVSVCDIDANGTKANLTLQVHQPFNNIIVCLKSL